MLDLNFDEIGRKIKNRRKELNMTQPELAAKVNLGVSSISRYENGKVEDATTAKLNEFAHVLGLDISYLLGMTNNPGTDGTVYFPRISKKTGHYTDRKPREEVEQLRDYIEQLPESAIKEAKDYLEYLLAKHKNN